MTPRSRVPITRFRPGRWTCAAASAALIAFAAPSQSAAQSFGVNVGASTTATVLPTGKLTVPIIIDLTNQGAANIAALAGTITWGSTRLTLDSLRVVAALGWAFNQNTSGAATGSSTFDASDDAPLPATSTLANVFFTASATAGGTRVAVAPTSAANVTAQSILALLRPRLLDVCVAVSGKWGDANNNGVVDIVDAQQLARHSVLLSVADLPATTQRGDVNADALVNIIDAQQVARFAVGLSTSPRTNTESFVAPVVASMLVSPSADQTINAGATLQLTSTPRDGSSADLSGCAGVTWESSNTAVATVNASGLVVGVAPGTANITVRAASNPGVFATVIVNVQSGALATIQVTLTQPTLSLNGSTTTTIVGRDAGNNVVAVPSPVYSVADHRIARITNSGAIQALGSGSTTVTVTSGAISGNATLTVNVAAGNFNIQLINAGPALSPEVQAAFDAAEARWEELIRGDLTDFNLGSNFDMSPCVGMAAGTVLFSGVLDDIVIYINVAAIDGVGSILGQAGPCLLRPGGPGAGSLPLAGGMTFDSADMANMTASGILTAVILHEMAHVLGIGTRWTANGLLANPAPANPDPAGDPTFTGVNGQWAFLNLGTGYGGAIVPVENCCSSGTRNSHWRESTLVRELMTGFVTGGVGAINPLSPLTAASLIDLGYTVNVAASDPAPWFERINPSRMELKRIPIGEILLTNPRVFTGGR